MRRLLIPLLFLVFPTTAVAGNEVLLAPGTPFETPAYLVSGKEAGPTVVIVGGMHGNETAGWRAARCIRHWPLAKGRLVVIPTANRLGIRKIVRKVPAEKPYDLNRCFPSKEGGEIAGPLAKDIWALIERVKPDWVVDLHESFNYRSASSEKRKYLGNTLICWPHDETFAAAKEMTAAANVLTSRKDRKWQVLRSPIEGSLARAAATRLRARALIVESCRKDHLAIRVRQHRIVVFRLLSRLGMPAGGASPYTTLPAEREPGRIRVALFNTIGTGLNSAWKVERCLTTDARFVCRRITATEIMAGALAPYDVVVFPGGLASTSGNALTKKGRAAVRKFVADGGGYLGVCAGAYLAATGYEWSLSILDARIVDMKHWARGTGTVRLSTTSLGRRMLAEKRSEASVRYGQGPLLAPGGSSKLPDYETVATYTTEIAKNGAPKGIMKGKPALVRSRYGKGRVVAVSPHPEDSRDRTLRAWVRRSVEWVAGSRGGSSRQSRNSSSRNTSGSFRNDFVVR
ncbi:MAG: BPL-N domain-containing protein [Planctomycetota bacterium]